MTVQITMTARSVYCYVNRTRVNKRTLIRSRANWLGMPHSDFSECSLDVDIYAPSVLYQMGADQNGGDKCDVCVHRSPSVLVESQEYELTRARTMRPQVQYETCRKCEET
jgi:hypothetical protein